MHTHTVQSNGAASGRSKASSVHSDSSYRTDPASLADEELLGEKPNTLILV